MADQTLLRNRMAEFESQVQWMMELLEQAPKSPLVALFPLMDTLHSSFETLQKAAEVNLLKRGVVRDEDRAPMSKVARILEAEKVSITSIYLTGDVKLWWCTRLSDNASANRDKIETWDVLKKELKDQFLPCNTSWLQGNLSKN
ncbi:hypothetical protein Sango_2914200 [Sesamum angolense]|uniref:Uncharacterized protein n=1 Tax=Sesamum angolense TaxID=2727404 RepID=A0AAE1T5Q2_9LAMI|nr:hypothetical protein Sango_2914200 [Sesamum angolense]